MTSTQPKHPSTFIAYEGSGGFSRESMVVAPNQTLVPGQVVGVTVGRESGQNEVTALDPSGTDGSQIAAGILVHTVSHGPATQKATILAHRAEVRASELTWPAKISNVQRAAAIKQLEAVGILVK
ncbi:MAG: head decoration protein [Bradyrhizobium sp.]|nr:head decoration protein [Bradyrhizobium sp.]